MYGYVLQDWVTIRGATGVLAIAQGENGWLGLAPFEDIVLWLDCREVNAGGGTAVTIAYETAPIKEDSLFTPMTAAATIAAASTPAITKILLSQNPTVPLGRWVRWKLAVTGSPTSAWDATFRVLCTANAVGLANL